METQTTVPDILAAKGARRLVMVTAADAPSAAWADAAGVDLILVGDSLAMAVLGRPHTLTVTLAEMAHHVRAVTAAPRRALVVGDMPFGSYQASVEQAVRSACELVAAGAAAVKLEGPRSSEVAAIVAAGVPVVGHLGLTPQSFHALGGYRVQGKEASAARRLLQQARTLEAAGAFLVVLEAVPSSLGTRITQALSVPTIGIGAGPGCDGQVLVSADLLGYASGPQPRFVRRYAELGDTATAAIGRFVADVREGRYPAPEECYPSPPGLEAALAAEEEV
ncbi:MAG: 3-methyl-2-oxobutanoate hydroxymethyltransferase [Thermoanaerobaculaceae bacterium]|nr:3-methyl-2-oxobutanoate hydroxymethyltransferase [Thermoanaerobaculaceae bacterium]MDI9620430.1 3-methyl-2-oxobutanoate hydroxymethyltransferase [Acidobacteriota bacterium]NLH12776.1 3-methyl-2-oxobutanoate hydroxymethyltransferase [Holophagae bacterium]HPW55754.1 3-methyl-2-oxobutanoate hydroxymethyltransferase [Thermoanaerobaculaceae bacterium]